MGPPSAVARGGRGGPRGIAPDGREISGAPARSLPVTLQGGPARPDAERTIHGCSEAARALLGPVTPDVQTPIEQGGWAMRWGTRVVVIGLGALAVLSLSVVREARAQGAQVGKTLFPTSCSSAVQADFERAVAMLHSFWFQESGNTFAGVLQADPGCAMGHWGVAMNSARQSVRLATESEGAHRRAGGVERAEAMGAKTPRERDYIAAIAVFYKRRGHGRSSHPRPRL